MSDLYDMYSAMQAGLDSARAMESLSHHWSTRERAQANIGALESGIAAYHRLERDLKDGRKHIEPPDDFKHTECYCGAPTCNPPCSFCTDPANNIEEEAAP